MEVIYKRGTKVLVHYCHDGHGGFDKLAIITGRGYMPDSWRVVYPANGVQEIVHERFIRKEMS